MTEPITTAPATPPPPVSKRPQPKSARRRAREIALQGLYEWLLSGAEAKLVDAHMREQEGFEKCDSVHFDALLHGCIGEAVMIDGVLAAHVDRRTSQLSPVEHGVRDGDAVVERDARHRGAALVRDELEVVGLAAHDAAERDQRVPVVGLGERLQRQADLERAGHADVADVRAHHAEGVQLGETRLGERIGEGRVEARLHDADAQRAAIDRGDQATAGGGASIGLLHGRRLAWVGFRCRRRRSR